MSRRVALLALLLCGCGADWYLEKGERAVRDMELVDAERAFRSALAREPDSVDALYGLGWTYHLAGHQDEARETFERCLQVAPESALGYKGLGSIALAEGNIEVAEARLEQALQRAPTDPSLLNSQALILIRTERYDEALAAYEALRADAPEQLELVVGQAEALLRLERLDEALAVVDGALAAGGADPRQATLLHTLRARALHANTTGRLDEERCEQTAPPLLAWLDEADRSLDQAESLGLQLDALHSVRREVHLRRKLVQRKCPGVDDVSKGR
jgi:tetratricopeptide (TPR) repeat protein